MLKHKLSKVVVEEIVRDAVSIEKEFITDALPCNDPHDKYQIFQNVQ